MRRKPTQRPEFFTLDSNHPLYRVLAFAHLGQHPGSTFYKDESPFQNHGTLIGFTGNGNRPADRWTRDGAIGRAALWFDAGATFVQTTYRASLNDFTAACWFWTTAALSVNNSATQMGKGYTAGFDLTTYTFSHPHNYYSGSVLGSAGAVGLATLLPYGAWHHVAVMRAGSLQLYYADGVFVGQHAGGATTALDTSALCVGCEFSDGTSHWGGLIADPMVFTSALPAATIRALADPGNVDYRVGGRPLVLPVRRFHPAGVPAPPPTGYAAVVLADSPLSYWPLDESAGAGTVADSAGANTGTPTAGVTLGGAGVANTAAAFNGTTGAVTFGSGTALPLSTAFTLEAWVKVAAGYSWSGVKGVIGYGNYNVLNQINAMHLTSPTNLMADWWANNVSFPIPDCRDGAYHHAAVSWDGTTRRGYWDGAQIGTGTASSGMAVPNQANAAIGVTYAPSGWYWPGSIDEPAVYGAALSPSRVAAHFNFIRPAGAGARSSADGLDASFNFGTANPTAGATSFLASCWVYVNSFSPDAAEDFFTKKNASTANPGWALRRAAGADQLAFYCQGGGTSTTSDGMGPVAGQGWVHVAGFFSVPAAEGTQITFLGGVASRDYAIFFDPTGNTTDPLSVALPGPNVAVAETCIFRNITRAQALVTAANLAAGRSPLAQAAPPAFYARFASGATEASLVGSYTATVPGNSLAFAGPAVDAPPAAVAYPVLLLLAG